MLWRKEIALVWQCSCKEGPFSPLLLCEVTPVMQSLWKQASPNRGECAQRKFHYLVFVKNAPVPTCPICWKSPPTLYFLVGEHDHGWWRRRRREGILSCLFQTRDNKFWYNVITLLVFNIISIQKWVVLTSQLVACGKTMFGSDQCFSLQNIVWIKLTKMTTSLGWVHTWFSKQLWALYKHIFYQR